MLSTIFFAWVLALLQTAGADDAVVYALWKQIIEAIENKKECRKNGGKYQKRKKKCQAPEASKLRCKKIKRMESCGMTGCEVKVKRSGKVVCGGSPRFKVPKIVQGQVWHGGPIVTMETAEPETIRNGCVVVKKPTILAVHDDVARCKTDFPEDDGWEWKDIDGKTLMPGLVEPHMHPGIAATVMTNEILGMYDWVIPGKGRQYGVQTPDAYLVELQKRLDAFKFEGKLFATWGYHQLWHGAINKTLLSSMADFPVAVIHRSAHEVYLNQVGLDFLEIKRKEWDDHPQADYDEGHCYEDCWIAFCQKPKVAEQLFNPISYAEGLSLTTKLVVKNGITTVGDPNFPITTVAGDLLMLEQEVQKDLPYRLYMVPSHKAMKIATGSDKAAFEAIDRMPADLDKPEMRYFIPPRQIKLFADGAIYSQAMKMEGGYLDDNGNPTGYDGEWITPPDEIRAQIEMYWKANYKIAVHCNGDLGAKTMLDIVRERVEWDKEHGTEWEHRFTLHHLGYFRPDQAEEMAELGIEASTNPYYLWALADKYAKHGLGEDRAMNLVAMGSLHRNGIPISFHSDFSMAPVEPMTLAWVAANRVTSEETEASPGEKLSLWDSLRGITIVAARTLELEDEIGSLKAGKKADFVILNQNPLDVDQMLLNKVTVNYTVFEGRDDYDIDVA